MKKKSKKLRYDESYIPLGFTWISDAETLSLHCVLWSGFLTNSCLKPLYLHHHMQTKHNNLRDKLVKLFSSVNLKNQKKINNYWHHIQVFDLTRTLYEHYTLLVIFNQKNNATQDGSIFMLLNCKGLGKLHIWEKAVKKMDIIPLSNSTAFRCIDSMSSNVLWQIVSHLKDNGFLLPADL